MTGNKTNTPISRTNTLSLPLEDKTIIWLPGSNKYILVNPPADKIIEKMYRGEDHNAIQNYCTAEWGLPAEEASEAISVIKENIAEIDREQNDQFKVPDQEIPLFSGTFNSQRYYKMNGLTFYFEYETPEIEYLIHPKYAHLEIAPVSDAGCHFQLYKTDSKGVLAVNGEVIGSWRTDEAHFMTGKVSMEILQKIHHNEENDWMAVFHAAGVSNGKESIMVLGDSGQGKSTMAAVLMARGYQVLSDDFLPVESETSLHCSFPAAISVKKDALEILTPEFPELLHAQEYTYPVLNKTVRYLPNPDAAKGTPSKVPCKAMVFVQYQAGVKHNFMPLSKDIAFQKLVPDSWISPRGKNAKQFLNWFHQMPCYQLTYSCNESMLATVKSVFEDEV